MEARTIEQPPLLGVKGLELVKVRGKHNLSQAELASRMRKLGVLNARHQQISLWESQDEFCIDQSTFNAMDAAFTYTD